VHIEYGNWNALGAALNLNHKDLVEFFLKEGIDPEGPRMNGLKHTHLLETYLKNFNAGSTVLSLIEHGADRTAQDTDGQDFFYWGNYYPARKPIRLVKPQKIA